MEEKDKVKFSIKNVHYATKNSEGAYNTPVAMPGAVSLGLEPQGEVTPFYADGRVYFRATSNNGYAGDLEVAYVPVQFLKDVFKYKEDETTKVLTENANVQPEEFAILCEEEGDVSGTKFCFYSVSATRPKRELKTKEDKTEPSTQTISLTMTPLENGDVYSMTQEETPDETIQNWYKQVYVPGAAAASAAPASSNGK